MREAALDLRTAWAMAGPVRDVGDHRPAENLSLLLTHSADIVTGPQQAGVGEAEVRAPDDDQLVADLDAEHCAGADHQPGERLVLRAGGGIARRVVVRDYD